MKIDGISDICSNLSFQRFLRKLWRKRKCCRKKQVGAEDIGFVKDYLERERLKPQLGDFTLGEYTEKVIVYGFLMVRQYI